MRPVAQQRTLVEVPVTLSYQFVDSDGEPASPVSDVTVDVTSADGDISVNDGATSGSGTNPRTYDFTPGALGLYTVEWFVGGTLTATTLLEVVGGYYFTTAEFYAWAGQSGTRWNADEIIAARRVVEDTCESRRQTGTAWVPRYRRERVAGHGTAHLELSERFVREVLSVREYDLDGTYTTWTATQLAAIEVGGASSDSALAALTDGAVWAEGVGYVVEYLYGADTLPHDLKQAALEHCRWVLNNPAAPLTATLDRWSVGDVTGVAPPGDTDRLPWRVYATYQAHRWAGPAFAL